MSSRSDFRQQFQRAHIECSTFMLLVRPPAATPKTPVNGIGRCDRLAISDLQFDRTSAKTSLLLRLINDVGTYFYLFQGRPSTRENTEMGPICTKIVTIRSYNHLCTPTNLLLKILAGEVLLENQIRVLAVRLIPARSIDA